MAKAPTAEQLKTAIAWLDSNDGGTEPDGERSACIAVAIYLEGMLERRDARDAGCTVSYLRRIRAEQVSA